MRNTGSVSRILVLAGLSALALSACSYDYLQHTDRVTYSSGDAVKANLESETVNPSSRTQYDTRGLGKNGSVIPSSNGTTGQTSTKSP